MADRFSAWAFDEPMTPPPSDAELERWRVLGWVRVAEEGYALSTTGRRIAHERRAPKEGAK
jgi:hypothetical protein